MTAVERKIVHERLKDDPEVETPSEGTEPNRYVVVFPRNVACLTSSSAGSPPSSRRPADGDPRPAEARRVLLDDALAGIELVAGFDGPIVDVGSGGGTPGIPSPRRCPSAR